MTLQLPDVSERQALAILLRGVSGYMLAARLKGTAGASTFDRILILPTSAAAPGNSAVLAGAASRNNSPSPPAAFGRPIASPIVTPDQSDQDIAADTDADPDGQPVLQRPLPGMPSPGTPPPGMPPAVARRPPIFPGLQNAPNGPVGRPEAQPAQQPPATSPFSVPAGSGRPGVVTAPLPPPDGPGPTQLPTGR